MQSLHYSTDCTANQIYCLGNVKIISLLLFTEIGKVAFSQCIIFNLYLCSYLFQHSSYLTPNKKYSMSTLYQRFYYINSYYKSQLDQIRSDINLTNLFIFFTIAMIVSGNSESRIYKTDTDDKGQAQCSKVISP